MPGGKAARQPGLHLSGSLLCLQQVVRGLEHEEYSIISWGAGGTCKSLSATQWPLKGGPAADHSMPSDHRDQGLQEWFTIQTSPLSSLSNGQARFTDLDRRPVLLVAKQFHMCDLCSSQDEIEPYFPE